MRNFARINNYYNRIEAWKDWNEMRAQAMIMDRLDLIKEFTPKENAGWRMIDNCTKRLRKALGLSE